MYPQRLRFDALGTTCELLAIDLDARRLTEAATWVGAMHRRLTRFDPSSELSRFNAASGSWVAVSDILEALFRESLRAYAVSGGLVHAGVLGAMLAIGYTRTFAEGPTVTSAPPGQPPPPLPEMLEVREGEARLAAGTGIDLGGIAKGWLADRLASELGANVLVNLGGDLFARDGGPQGDGWPVGFGSESVLLRDAGAATSGTHFRRWGEDLHHLIDPRTGLPAKTDLVEVSVIARTAADAEILAKTALLLGSGRAPSFLAGRAQGRWLR